MGMLLSPFSVVPATVYPNLDPGDKDSTITLSNANLTATKNATTGVAYAFAVNGKESGKWRFEVTVVNATNEFSVGLTGGLFNGRAVYLGANADGIALNHGGVGGTGAGVITSGATQYSGGIDLPAGTVIDVYVDVDAGKVWFAKDGVILNGSPAAGTGGTTMTSGMKKAWYPTAFLVGANCSLTFNFGATAWVNAGVAGFNGWSAVAGTGFATFRSAALFIRSLGYFSHGIAEFELEATSGGANVLSGATVTASAAVTFGTLAGTNDANTATSGGIGSTGSQNQANAYFAYELAANAARNVAFGAIRARQESDGVGASLQAPTLFDIWLSTGTVATGAWYRAKTGVAPGAYAATTPGNRKEFAVP